MSNFPCGITLKGVTGPTGPRGPIGPTGPTGSTVEFLGFQAQNQNGEIITLNNSEAVQFNAVVNSSSPDISLTLPSTFTLTSTGTYLINYFLNINGSLDDFAILRLNVSDGTQIDTSVSVEGANQIVGNALITVTSAPVNFQILNITGSGIILTNLPVGADITITHLKHYT